MPGIMDTCKDINVEHAAEEEVRFERSIDARSARIEPGCCGLFSVFLSNSEKR